MNVVTIVRVYSFYSDILSLAARSFSLSFSFYTSISPLSHGRCLRLVFDITYHPLATPFLERNMNKCSRLNAHTLGERMREKYKYLTFASHEQEHVEKKRNAAIKLVK